MIFAIVLTLLALLFVIVTKKSMTSLIADVLLLVITLSGVLRGLSSNIENLLPLIGAKSFAFGRIEGTQTSQLYGFTLLVVEGILFLVFIMVVEKIRMGRKNGKSIFSLIVKKYSLKPVKYQITIQSFLIGFVCLLSILPVAINDTVVQLSIKQALVFASILSVSIGCVNAFVELQSHETKTSLFGKWKKDLKFNSDPVRRIM